MNHEIWLTNIAGIKLLIAAFIGWCYSRAGRGWKPPLIGKFRRRVYLPLILCVSWLIFSFVQNVFSWGLLLMICLSWVVYYLSMSIFSYGEDSWLRKIFGKTAQQFIVGGIHGGSCILIAISMGNWGIYTLSCIVPSLTLGFLGSWFDNDTNASFKEALVGMAIFLFPLFLF